MATTIEAMGLTLPGSSSYPALSPEKSRECERAAKVIKTTVAKDIRPYILMTRAAFENALRASDRTSCLADLAPSGQSLMEDLYKVGGTPSVLKMLIAKKIVDCSSRQLNCHEPERNRHGQKIWYCKRCSYSQAAHNRVRSHLRDKHCIWIAEQQTAKKLGQDIAIDRLFKQQAARQEGHDIEQDRHLRAAIHEEAYNQALVNLITVHSLPYSLVEWPEWYAVLHTVNRMAPATVTQSRGQIPRLLEASFSSHREALACNIAASVTQIHFTIDTWSSPSQHGLLAIVAHFINDESRQPRKALLALRELKGAHSGDSLAEIFTEVIDSYGMRDKTGYFTLDNASNNDTILRALANTFGFNPAHRRLRCHGHIINLAVQAFLFGKNKDASDEAMRQWDKSSLDEVICSMDFFVTHYKAAMKRYQGNVTMTDRIMTSWYKFDDYYTRTDDSPVYAAAILLHPSLRMAHMTEAWKDQAQYIEPAIRAVRTLWEDFKPEKEHEVEEDLSAYEAYKKRIYQSSSTYDEFDRFIEGSALPIGASSALSWWLETTQNRILRFNSLP
ncbi:hypothetical protein ARSEF1564_009122 [Beauveria bassiana]